MAVGCISAATARGLSVPDNLSVVGFDDAKLASYTNPPLTTVAQPIWQIRTVAVEMLMERIQDIEPPMRVEQLDTRLIVRQSTARRRN